VSAQRYVSVLISDKSADTFMKDNLHLKIHKKMVGHDKLYGTTTMGTRGQVVIPADARKDLNLKPGDHLLVMGKFGKVLGFVKADQMESFIKTIMDNLAGSGMEKAAGEYIKEFMEGINKS
jgi:AbrB family looped-hinge helix DNA binding protein